MWARWFSPGFLLPLACLTTGTLLLIGSGRRLFSPGGPPGCALRSAALVLLWGSAGAMTERTHHRRFVACPLVTSPALQPLIAHRIPVPLRGRVADDPTTDRDRRVFLLSVEEVRLQGRWQRCPGKIRISLRDPLGRASLRYADRIEVSARLRLARNFRNPGAFNYLRYLESEGIHLLGSVKDPRLVVRMSPRRGTPLVFLHRLRERLLRRVAEAFPGREGQECRRFLEAILLGERRREEGELGILFRKTGVYHILSISGLHFGLLLAGLKRVSRHLPYGAGLAPWIQAGTALLYVALSGGDDPILRSALAAGVVSIGRWSGRRISAWDAQSHAALVLLLDRPLRAFDPGFLLSFAASWGLLAGTAPWWPRLRALPAVGESLAASASAWLVSTPILAASFLQVSPIALFLNLLAAPVLSGTLFLGAALLVAPVHPVALLAQCILDLFASACRTALKVPGSFLRIVPPDPLMLLIFSALLLARLALGSRASPGEGRALSGCLLAALLGIGASPVTGHPDGRIDFVAFDVGQGDALLLRLPQGKTLLIDAGGFAGSDFDVGEKVVVPALLSLGVRRLEVVVLTHAHQDHDGGLEAVLEAFPPREIWMGRMPTDSSLVSRIAEAARARGVPLSHPTRGSFRCFGSACLEVLHPPEGYRRGAPVANDDSLVLRLGYRATSLLLTGDIEREGEETLLLSTPRLRSDLLKVAHHGSDSSTSASFLDRVAAEAAVVSVGNGNPWGHPSPRVLARLSSRRIEISRTDRQGAVEYVSDGTRWLRKEPPGPPEFRTPNAGGPP